MADAQHHHRYRHIEGKHWIEVRVKSSKHLFDARDPSPFRERDLDDDLADYIYLSAREIKSSTPLKIVIYNEEKEDRDLSPAAIREAIHSFLAYKIDLQRSELRVFLRRAPLFLLIGLFILGACVGLSQQLLDPSDSRPMKVLSEGLVIFGWVSLWKPLELIMFDWFPLFEKLRIYKRLYKAEVEIRYSTSLGNT